MAFVNLKDPGKIDSYTIVSAFMCVFAIALLTYAFWDAIRFMVGNWNRDEYNHGYLIPFVTAVLIWQRRHELAALEPKGWWLGPVLLFVAVAMLISGELSTLYIIIQYGALAAIYALFISLFGINGAIRFIAPLALLVFMIPLPEFLYQKVSIVLQNVSSQLGVWMIRVFGISVFLEGNIIDLGVYKLAVVEACSGLRYLFPLMSFGFICAYLFRAHFLLRVVVFLTTIPIAILLNGLRIGINGVLIDLFGISVGEGFLHLFEGWVIFLACVLMLTLEIWILNRIFYPDNSLFQALGLAPGGGGDANEPKVSRPVRRKGRTSIVAACVLLISALAVAAGFKMDGRSEVNLARKEFNAFPMRIHDWRGMPGALEPEIVDSLALTDYLLADYVSPNSQSFVNLYIAYYASQRKGEAVHSPQSCIPGGGWEIVELGTRVIDDPVAGQLQVNRAIIQKGTIRQLVYYWFEQRGRHLTNEYLVKWYLFWDGLTMNRTDGALVRLVSPITPGESERQADERIESFLQAALPIIPDSLGSVDDSKQN